MSAIQKLSNYGLVDNRDLKLLDVLRDVLTSGEYKQVDIAVGFLFITGLKEIQDALDNFFSNGGVMRVIIGNQTNKETFEQLSIVYHSIEHLKKLREKLNMSKPDFEKQSENIKENVNFMEQNSENESFLNKLTEWIQNDNLKIRIYVKEFMHAKAYLFYPKSEYVPSFGLVGSSNFTLAGFYGNTELNAIVSTTHFKNLKEWYEKLWEESVDFNPKLLEIINNSWAGQKAENLPLPYEVLIRGLYELYREVLDSDSGLLIKNLSNTLYDFQLDAAKRAISIVNKYRGVLISDVVGLGKSYIGLAVLEHFSLLDLLNGKPHKVAVLTPPELVRYWEELLRNYNIDGRVFSTGLLPRNELSSDKYKEMKEFIKNQVGTVLVDESHHYVNPNTKSYNNLQELIIGKRVVLLTATPYRKQYRDIINQIRLFIPEKRHPFPITPQTWDELIREIEKGNIDPSYILREIMIRRTRHDILKLYGGDGNCIKLGRKKLCFPKRTLKVIEYSISKISPIDKIPKRLITTVTNSSTISKIDDIYSFLLAGISSMKYARFSLYDYVKPQFKDKEPYKNLSVASKNLKGLEKILYLKRLESSWYAMYQTLNRDIIKTRNFLKFIMHGLIPAGDEFDEVLLGKIFDDNRTPKELTDEQVREFVETYKKQKEPEYKIGAFNIKKLIADIEWDLEKLEAMKEALEPIKKIIEKDPSKDPKLTKLVSLIDELMISGRRKILIFSEFEETVRWIYNGLEKLGYVEKYEIEWISSNAKGIIDKIRRFAPKANNYIVDNEIDILITTDVLSEGLNLQDANIVVNYDLHWTPVKLIQRIGRVDRIGTEHDEIFIYNFFPERKLDENLGLLEKIRRRIAEFNNALGADGKILEESEAWQPSAIEAIYKGDIDKLEATTDILSVTTLAEKLVREFKEKNPKKFDNLKNYYSMRSIVKYNGNDYYAFFVCSDGIIAQYFIYKLQNGNWVRMNIDFENLLNNTNLSEKTKPYYNFDNMELYYMAAKKALKDFDKIRVIKASSFNLRKDTSRTSDKVKKIIEKLYKKMLKTQNDSEKLVLSQLIDLVKWGYANHELFAKALKEVNPNMNIEKIVEACLELVKKYEIVSRKKEFEKKREEFGDQGIKPHIVAGLLFVPSQD